MASPYVLQAHLTRSGRIWDMMRMWLKSRAEVGLGTQRETQPRRIGHYFCLLDALAGNRSRVKGCNQREAIPLFAGQNDSSAAEEAEEAAGGGRRRRAHMG